MRTLSIKILSVLFFLAGFSISNSHSQGLDPSGLFSRIHATNEFEIKVGHLAMEKGQSEKVKKYGERLVRDHKNADEKVMALAKEENIQISKPEPRNKQEKMMMQKRKELLSKFKKAGPESFDEIYLNAMVKGHQHAIDMLTKADLKNQEVNELVSKLVPILEQHLNLAENLKKEVI
jgi:putative membrane protein